jgi:hypothetical protein
VSEPEPFLPFDPLAVDVEWLRDWMSLLLEVEAMARELGLELGAGVLLPGERVLEAVDFRCWLCRRVFLKSQTDAEAVADFLARHPGEEMEPGKTFCGDCIDVMEAWAAGHPEEWR